MFHRFGWCYRPKASSLTLVREHSMDAPWCHAHGAAIRQTCLSIRANSYRTGRDQCCATAAALIVGD